MDSDLQLLQRIACRDEAAFDRFYARHVEATRRRLWRMVRDHATAEDLLQEAFLRVWQRAEQYTGRGGVHAWLGRIATNLALNQLRTTRRQRQRPLDIRPAATDDDESTLTLTYVDEQARAPDALAEAAERRDLLDRLVEELDAPKRDVWRLIHDEDLDIATVAEELNIPPGTVKSRLYHARKALAGAWHQIDSP